MPTIEEQVVERFYDWEALGRGGLPPYPDPVFPEPPYIPFPGYEIQRREPIDDGRRETLVSSLFKSFTPSASLPPSTTEDDEPVYEFRTFNTRTPITEFRVELPHRFNANPKAFHDLLCQLGRCAFPISLEFVATQGRILLLLTAFQPDDAMLASQISAYFPEAVLLPAPGSLTKAYKEISPSSIGVVELGLEHEFLIPISPAQLDPLVAVVGALSQLQPNEFAAYQILFQTTSRPWADGVNHALYQADGSPMFTDPHGVKISKAAQKKLSEPLFSVVLRLVAGAPQSRRAVEVLRLLNSALDVFSSPAGNAFELLSNDEYDHDDHIEDFLNRQSRRFGMLLNTSELMGIVNFPSSLVRSPNLVRQTGASKLAPDRLASPTSLCLGINEHHGNSRRVYLSPENRVRHTHIIGAPGTGKSTILLNLIRQDMENGEGLAVFDPHGDLIDTVLAMTPDHRMDDVILIDPSDESSVVPFNILSAQSGWEKALLASDLVALFERLSVSWGDQMSVVLRNAVLAFLESDRGGTLSDLSRFLIEPDYRKEFIYTVQDPQVAYYWTTAFEQLTGNRSIGPITTRLQTFLSPKPIRSMVSQGENKLDFTEIMDDGKIFLARLPQGLIGEENAYLLGSLFVSKFQQTAMSRQRQESSARRDFWIYIDEFHHFITRSMGELITGARKYRVGMTLAHQNLAQLKRHDEVASAVQSSSAVQIVFRTGEADARKLDGGFADFEAKDILGLETFNAICRVERSDHDFNLLTSYPDLPDDADERRLRAIETSRAQFGVPLQDITFDVQPTPPPSQPKSTQPSASTQPSTPQPTQSGGRGGPEHKSIQHEIQKTAQEAGFRAIIEKSILNRHGHVDVSLERDQLRIACEICVTTPVQHEVSNSVGKALQAGYQYILCISPNVDQLTALEAALQPPVLDSADLAKIRFLQPNEFRAFIGAFAFATEVSQDGIQLGWKISESHPTGAEAEKRRDEALLLIQQAIGGPQQGSKKLNPKPPEST